jgi:hypothetical protein
MEHWQENWSGICIDVYEIIRHRYITVILWKNLNSVAIKSLWMKGLGARRIHTKLSRVLGDDCYSPAATESWHARFRTGDLLCADHSRSGRPVIVISECLRAFLDKFPFANVNMMSKHFCIARGTIMEILQRDLGPKKLSHRWVPHELGSSQTLIVSINLELYCTCYDSYNRSILRE